MNKARRIEIARAVAMIEEAKEILGTCSAEEQEYYDNMPESLQGGSKGDLAQANVAVLDDAVSALENVDLDGIE